MPQVIETLERDHANITKLLELIESEILAIEVGKTPGYPLMQDVMRYIAQYSDRFHHPKEDLIYAQLLKRDLELSRGPAQDRGTHLGGSHLRLQRITRGEVLARRIQESTAISRRSVGWRVYRRDHKSLLSGSH